MLPIPDHIVSDLDELLKRAIREDVGSGDVTSLATLRADKQARARFLSKADGIIAGRAVAERVFSTLDSTLSINWEKKDGDHTKRGEYFGEVSGNVRSILSAERLALNIMQRMSGIATKANKMAEQARPAIVLDTRKTAPGLRMLDKWAVELGGASNHRMGLFDMVLIKDNHIAASGGIEEAILATRKYLGDNSLNLPVEIETRTLEEVDEVLRVGRIDRVLLDNMVVRHSSGVDVSMLREAVERINGRFETEASGNVTLETVAAIATTGVDFISSGALTHSVHALDISLEVELDIQPG